MNKDLTIDDLKYGYVVEFRNGYKGLYMPCQQFDIFYIKYNSDEYGDISISNYKSDLKHYITSDFDIMKVFGYTKYCCNAIKPTVDGRDIIWERHEKETVTMTIDEIKEKLEELLDKNIDINYDIHMKVAILNQYCKTNHTCKNCIFKNDSCDFNCFNDEEVNKCYKKYINEKEKDE